MNIDDRSRGLSEDLRAEVNEAVVDVSAAIDRFRQRTDQVRRRRQVGAALTVIAVVIGVAVVLADTAGRRAANVPAHDPMTTVTPTGMERIALGSAPVRVAARAGTVWVSTDTGNVLEVDIETRSVRTVAELPGTLFDIQPTRRWVWVSLPFENRILALAPNDGSIAHTITVDEPGPRGLSLAGGSLWATGGRSVLQIDPDTGATERTIPLPDLTLAYDVTATKDSVWVSDSGGTAVYRYQLPDGPVRRIDVGSATTGIVAIKDTVFAAAVDHNYVLRLNARTAELLSRPALPSPGLGLSIVGSQVWVGVPDSDLVLSLDPANGHRTRTWRAGDFPPIVTGDQSNIYVSSNRSHELLAVPLDQ